MENFIIIALICFLIFSEAFVIISFIRRSYHHGEIAVYDILALILCIVSAPIIIFVVPEITDITLWKRRKGRGL